MSGQSTDLAVIIKGANQASPAFVSAQRDAKAFGQTLSEDSREVVALNGRLTQLRQQHALGLTSAHQYAGALKELTADARALAVQAGTTAEAEARLARIAQQATQAATSTGRTDRREAMKVDQLVMGLGALTEGGEGAAAAIGKVSGALGFLTMGNPELFALVTGIGLVAAGVESITKASDEATVSLSSMLRDARAVGPAGTAQRRKDLEDRLAAVPAYRSGIDLVLHGSAAAERRDIQEQIDNLGIVQLIVHNDPARERNRTRPARQPREPDPYGRGSYLDGGPRIGHNEELDRIVARYDAPRTALGERSPVDQASDRVRNMFGTAPSDDEAAKIARVNDALEKTAENMDHIRKFSELSASAFGAFVDAVGSGGHVVNKFIQAEAKQLAGMARGKAIYHFGEGVADLFLAPAKAAGEFQSAALFTAASIALGAIGGGGGGGSPAGGAGGGGGAGDSGGRALGGAGSQGSRAPTTIIQFVTADGREISRTIVESNARQERLGAPPTLRLALPGIVIAGPVQRT